MAFEERFALLREKSQRDFDEYLREVAHMDAPGVFREAMKIVVMEEMLSQIKSGQFEHPFDVELLLYHDRPLLAAYGRWEQDGLGIKTAVNESVNGFIAKTRNQVAEMQAGYDTLAPDEQEQIMEYHNRELAVFDYLQGAEIREKKLSELMETIDRDYADCQAYIKNYKDIKGEHPTGFADAVQSIYNRMKTYDGYTDEQLTALKRIHDPLTSVYRVFNEAMHGNPANMDEIDTAIRGFAKARAGMERPNSTEETQEQDDGLDR